ncbi:MAG TPA: choice-of-anchor Q domain-containing protein [Chiayiivirga sp.]|nr:choice-of-anchor Q domain-containing protein [Chiayiivirga sp.]
MTLQAALLDTACSELWVAAGVYLPGSAPEDSFLIEADTAMYGGFSGTELSRDERDPQVNVTILSGDLDQDDVQAGTAGITADADDIRGSNSHHVVQILSTQAAPMGWAAPVVVDGFVITAGDAREVGNGGGMVLRRDAGVMNTNSLNLYQLIFRGNAAINGGGLGRDANSQPWTELGGWDLLFQGNLAQGVNGADGADGVSGDFGLAPGENGGDGGDGLPGGAGGDASGGAIYGVEGLFRNIGLFDNRAIAGNGGRGGDGGAGGNGATAGQGGNGGQGGQGGDGGQGGVARGGAIFMMSSPGMSNVTAYGNRVVGGDGGDAGAVGPGGLAGTGGVPGTMGPAVMIGGDGGDAEGGVFHGSLNDGFDLSFSTLVNNTALSGSAGWGEGGTNGALGQSRGGALFTAVTSDYSIYLQGVIVWNNHADFGAQIFNQGLNGDPAHVPQISYSLIEGAGNSGSTWDASVGIDQGDNIDTDPLLDMPADNGGLSPTLMPTAGSPVIDSAPWLCPYATPGACRELDQRGTPRPQGYGYDRGAVERLPAQRPVCYVDAAASGNDDGSTWANAWNDLQDSLVPGICGEVWVAQGSYRPTAGTDMAVSFRVLPKQRLYGGFSGTETSRDDRDPKAYPSILSGDLGVPGDVTDNSNTVVWLQSRTTFGPIESDTVIDGFVITAGNATGNAPDMPRVGGGLYCDRYCSPTLQQLVFEDNRAMSGGGALGLLIMGGPVDLHLRDLVFRNNHAQSIGAALVLTAQRDAGEEAITGEITLERVAFTNNSIQDPLTPGQSAAGAAILQFAGAETLLDVRLTNTSWHANSADIGAALVLATGNGAVAHTQIEYATFNGNTGNGMGTVFFASDSPDATFQLDNVVLWDDPNVNGELIMYNDLSGSGTAPPIIGIDGGLVRGGCPAVATCMAVQDADPLLGAWLDHGGFVPGQLPAAGSPAIDAAGSCLLVQDQRGVARAQGPGCDYGALEVKQAQLTVVVSTPGGEVSAAAVPVPNGPAINECRQTSGVCSAWYSIEPAFPTMSLDITPDAGWHLVAPAGCSGPLTADCTVSIGFARNQHHVGGVLSGLASGSSVVLQLNGANDLTLAANGSFQFPQTLSYQDSYIVTVSSQPGSPAQTCSLSNANGTLPDADVTSVLVSCSADEFLVSTQVTSGNGQLTPSDQWVARSATADFTAIPDTGWKIGSITGCGGSLNGAVYSTGPITAACTVAASFVADASGICRVRADAGAGTGMVWASPMTLQAALAHAYCQEIWVAAGVYLPGAQPTDSFVIPSGVAVYGGFTGNETARDQRDTAAHHAILSGDLGGDDASNNGVLAHADGIVGSNSHHVVLLDGTGQAMGAGTVMDGLVITAGDAGAGDGGGMQCLGQCQAALTQLHFSGNRAMRGGALYTAGSAASPDISRSAFTGNTATQGGAIYNNGSAGQASPVVSNSTFSGNRANSEGGAIYNDGRGGVSSPLLLNLTLTSNQAQRGAAIYSTAVAGASAPDLSNLIVWGNLNDSGDDVVNDQAQPYIAYSIIRGAYVGPNHDWNNAIGLDGGHNLDSDPQLLPLADNGGATPTHMILRWSIPVDRADPATCPDVDERGVSRPQDAVCDIGAVEHRRGDAGSMFWDGFE